MQGLLQVQLPTDVGELYRQLHVAAAIRILDANVVLGRLNPNGILGGRMDLDVEASKRVIQEHICDKTNLSLLEAASGILSIVNANMTRGVRLISVEKGHSPSDFALVSFGGGGGLHCGALAKALNIPHVIVPPSPGTFCSLGLLVTDIRRDYVRTELLEPGEDSLITIRQHFESMKVEGTQLLAKENVHPSKRSFSLDIDVRFVGQNYELPVPVQWEELTSDGVQHIISRFHKIHEKNYGYSDEEGKIEFVNYRVTAFGELPKAPLC
ncbi:hypothetical protein CKF96_04315 (plasmid) [Priestia filamentosa]|nr:hypothetical protein CKF96_04315 [Priestia filamentosa]